MPEVEIPARDTALPGRGREQWGLASWMLGRSIKQAGLGTALLAAGGASTAGFLGELSRCCSDTSCAQQMSCNLYLLITPAL